MAVVCIGLFMAIPANLELAAHGERRRTSLARFYLEHERLALGGRTPRARPRQAPARCYLNHERLAIGGGRLVAVLLLWEALGRSGLVDPLFISSPTQVAQAGWQLGHERDFWDE